MDALEAELRSLVPYAREVTLVPNQYNFSREVRISWSMRLDFRDHCIYVDLDHDKRPVRVGLGRARMDMSGLDERIREEALERLRLLDAVASIRKHLGIQA